jgi:cation transport ATPase
VLSVWSLLSASRASSLALIPGTIFSMAVQEFTEAAAVVFLFGLAGFLEDKCSMAARDAIAAVLALKPESAIIAATGSVLLSSLLLFYIATIGASKI